jgi:hypothetical protein
VAGIDHRRRPDDDELLRAIVDLKERLSTLTPTADCVAD